MSSQKPRKIIITGPTRAGTTFLVELLTRLGLDTGFSPSNTPAIDTPASRAAREGDLESPAAPTIVKNAELYTGLPAVLARGKVAIDFTIIPVRNSLNTMRPPQSTLEDQASPSVQTNAFHAFMETLVAHDIPHTFLHFPRFALDAAYAYGKLRPILGEITQREFESCFQSLLQSPILEQASAPATAVAPLPPLLRPATSPRQRRSLAQRSLRAAAALAFFSLGWLVSSYTDSKPTPRLAEDVRLPTDVAVRPPIQYEASPSPTAPEFIEPFHAANVPLDTDFLLSSTSPHTPQASATWFGLIGFQKRPGAAISSYQNFRDFSVR